MGRGFGWHNGSLSCYDITVTNDLTIQGDMTFGNAATDTLTVTGKLDANGDVDLGSGSGDTLNIKDDLTVSTSKKIQFRDTAIYLQSSADGTLDLVSDSLISLNEADFYSGVTDDGTGDRKDGVILITASRTSSGNPSDTQKIVDFNGTPGSNYNSWDIFTGAADNKDTIVLNIDAKRINTAATGAVTDRAFNITAENQTDSSGGTLDLVASHIKAANDGGKLQDLKSMHLELESDGTNTIAGDSDILQLQASGSVSGNTTGDTSCIKFTGNDNTDFAFNFEATSGCVGTGEGLTQSGNVDGYITLQIGSNTLYVNCYDAAPS